jgi:hypothetical protein
MRTILATVLLLMSHATWASALDIETYLALPETAQQFYVLGFTEGLAQGFLRDSDHKFSKRLTTSAPEQQRCVTSTRALHSATLDLLRSASFDAETRKSLRVENIVWFALERVCP